MYLGLRSDTSLYTFGFSWRPWKETTSIAEGHLITKYLNQSAQENGIDQHIQCNRQVNAARWSSEHKMWSLDVTGNGAEKTYRCRFMILCTGYYDYNEALDASIPGIKTFRGPVVHPQFWPEDLDYSKKDVVIIGSGATAVTFLPALAEQASHVTMLQRSPGYILSIPPQDGVEKFIWRWFRPAMQDGLLWLKWLLLPFIFVFCRLRYPFLRDPLTDRVLTGQHVLLLALLRSELHAQTDNGATGR